MNTKHLIITLVMVFAVFGVMPVLAAESVSIPGWDLKDRLPVTSIYSMEHR